MEDRTSAVDGPPKDCTPEGHYNHYILEVLTLPEKLRLVKAVSKVPKGVAANVEALNALGNGLAHAFFPENLRSSKPIYKGKDIFTVEGLTAFIGDMGKVSEFFLHRNFGVEPPGDSPVVDFETASVQA